jgi:class 3 adenylate cyclase
VDYVDLYCFLPGDLDDSVLDRAQPGVRETPVSRIARLNVRAFRQQWCRRERLGAYPSHYVGDRRITALATNLPNISSPDRRQRQETVAALERLLQLASHLSVPVVEIVAGPDFVRWQQERKEFPLEVTTGPTSLELRGSALLESLVYVNGVASRLRPPVAIALELEPGLSYLLNDWTSVETLFKQLGSHKRYIFLNLDIGHARLLCKDKPGFYRRLSARDWKGRIVHAHISHHDERAHMADLPLKPEYQPHYQPWIDLLVDAWYHEPRNPYASHTIALELEATSSDEDIRQSVRCLKEWVACSTERYSRWSWTECLERPTACKGAVLFLDLIDSSSYIQSQNLSPFVGVLMDITQKHDAFFDKFTGDGIMAVFLETPALPPKKLAEKALQCARALVFEARRKYATVFHEPEECFPGCQVGISAHDFTFGDHGLHGRPEVTATGPTVICAARLANERSKRKLKRHGPSPIFVTTEFLQYGSLAPQHFSRSSPKYTGAPSKITP